MKKTGNFLMLAVCSALFAFAPSGLNAQSIIVDVNLAPGNGTLSNGSIGNLRDDPANPSTFGTDETIFNATNDTQIAIGVGNASSTIGAFSLDDGLGNSGSYQLTLDIAATLADGSLARRYRAKAQPERKVPLEV